MSDYWEPHDPPHESLLTRWCIKEVRAATKDVARQAKPCLQVEDDGSIKLLIDYGHWDEDLTTKYVPLEKELWGEVGNYLPGASDEDEDYEEAETFIAVMEAYFQKTIASLKRRSKSVRKKGGLNRIEHDRQTRIEKQKDLPRSAAQFAQSFLSKVTLVRVGQELQLWDLAGIKPVQALEWFPPPYSWPSSVEANDAIKAVRVRLQASYVEPIWEPTT